MEYIPRQVTNSEVADTTIDHTGVASSFIHLATDAPDGNDDEGTGFAAGCLWIDYSNGETYVCADSTDESAVWHAQDGSDDVNVYPHQGKTTGFACGGVFNPSPSPQTLLDVVQSFSLTSSGDTSDYGELTTTDHSYAGSTVNQGPHTYGWVWGGKRGGFSNVINRFNMTGGAPQTSTDWGNLAYSTREIGGAGNDSKVFSFGGHNPPDDTQSTIESWAIASPGDGSDTSSEISQGRYAGAASQNATNAFFAGGSTGPAVVDTIDYFTMASVADSTDHGDLGETRAWCSGGNDLSYGYVAGGEPSPGLNIMRYPFTSSGGSADVGEISTQGSNAASRTVSSTTAGYIFGGNNGSPRGTDTIQKYTFASPSTASDQGEIIIPSGPPQHYYSQAGVQV